MNQTTLVAERPRALLDQSRRPASLIRPGTDADRLFNGGCMQLPLFGQLLETLHTAGEQRRWMTSLHLVRAPRWNNYNSDTSQHHSALIGERLSGDEHPLYGFYVRGSSVHITRSNPAVAEHLPQAFCHLGTLGRLPGMGEVLVRATSAEEDPVLRLQAIELNQLACLALEAATPDPGDRQRLLTACL